MPSPVPGLNPEELLVDLSRLEPNHARQTILWSEVPPPIARVLDLLVNRHRPLEIPTGSFSLDLFEGLTIRDLADVRGVGQHRIMQVLAYLDIMSEENPLRISPDLLHDPTEHLRSMQHEVSNEKSDATESKLDSYKRSTLDLYKRFPTGFLFTKESIELYGGTDKLIGKIGLNKRNPKTPLQVFGCLSQLVVSKNHLDVILAQTFIDNISLYLESFSPVSEIELLSTRLRYGRNVWQDFVVTQFGFTANRLKQFFPRVELHARIIELRAKGNTYHNIGNEIGNEIDNGSGLTRERIRQILQKNYQMLDDHGSSDIPIHAASGAQPALIRTPDRESRKRLASRSARRAAWVPRIRPCIVASPGISLSKLAEEVGAGTGEIRRFIPEDLIKFVDGMHRQVITPDRISNELLLEALRLAGTFHFPLSPSQFDDLVSIGEVSGPRSNVISRRFLTWAKACEMAGVESPKGATGDSYKPKWSRNEIVGFMAEYLLDPHTSGSARDYDVWRKGLTNDAPSMVHVTRVLGTWGDAISSALIRVGEMGPLDADVYGPSRGEVATR